MSTTSESRSYSGDFVSETFYTSTNMVVVVVSNNRSYPVNAIIKFSASDIRSVVIPAKQVVVERKNSNSSGYVDIQVSHQQTWQTTGGVMTVRYEN